MRKKNFSIQSDFTLLNLKKKWVGIFANIGDMRNLFCFVTFCITLWLIQKQKKNLKTTEKKTVAL